MSEIPAAAVDVAIDALVEGCEATGIDCTHREWHEAEARAALAAAAPLIRQDERQATADEIKAALTAEAERAGGPIFTKALEHAAEIARRVGGGGGGGHG